MRRAPALGLVGLVGWLAACHGQPPGSEVWKQRPPRTQDDPGLHRFVWLTSSGADELAGRLSPDGSRLVYASDQAGSFDLWLKELDSGRAERLTRSLSAETQPSWSPDGRRIVFSSTESDAKGDILLWEGGKLERLTDARTADGFPAFSPDGKQVYFAAAGSSDRARIEAIDLQSRRRRVVSGWGADHPAPSPDGKLLAMTWLDQRGRGRVVVLELGSGRSHLVTADDYPSAFPAFTPDGRALVVARFYRGAPFAARNPEAAASLWSIPVERALAGGRPEQIMASARQLTSDGDAAMFPQAHREGIVLTRRRGESLDVAKIPAGGILPDLKSADAQLRLALELDEPWERVLGLQRVGERWPRTAAAARALYLQGQLFLRLDEPHKAEAALQRLTAWAKALPRADEPHLARIDLVALPRSG